MDVLDGLIEDVSKHAARADRRAGQCKAAKVKAWARQSLEGGAKAAHSWIKGDERPEPQFILVGAASEILESR
eukprot:6789804-Lingulodinium_polyedra.AAC.1